MDQKVEAIYLIALGQVALIMGQDDEQRFVTQSLEESYDIIFKTKKERYFYAYGPKSKVNI